MFRDGSGQCSGKIAGSEESANGDDALPMSCGKGGAAADVDRRGQSVIRVSEAAEHKTVVATTTTMVMVMVMRLRVRVHGGAGEQR